MTYSESQKKASRKYNEKNYVRVCMWLRPEMKAKWLEAAEAEGITALSEFVKKCVNEHIAKNVGTISDET